MKRQSTWITTLIICGLIVGGWWVLSRKTIMASPLATLTAATPVPIKQAIRVEPNRVMTWPISAPDGKFPGRLYGHWTCRGKAAGIQGAHDDSLVAFKLVGPDNRIIQQSNHPFEGNFDLHVTGPGVYTFEFSNAGLLRSSARVIEFDGTYQPD